MKKTAMLSLLFAVFLLVLGNDFAVAKNDTIKWKMQCAYPPGDASYDISSVQFVERVKKVTNGKLEIKLFGPGALSPVNEMVSSLSLGVFEVGFTYGPAYSGSVPVGDIAGGLPYAWGDGDKGLEECIELFFGSKYRLVDAIREGYAKKNIYYLSPAWGDAYPFLLKFPMNKLEDLKGRKLRAMGSGAKFVKALGASPVSIPGGEIYMAMKLGTIEGTPFPPMILNKLKLQEVVDYAVFPGLCAPAVQFLVNKKAWLALPDDVRNAVNNDDFIIDLFRTNGINYREQDDIALKQAAEYGVKTIHLSEAVQKQGREIAISIWDEAGAKDKASADAVKILKKYHKDKGSL